MKYGEWVLIQLLKISAIYLIEYKSKNSQKHKKIGILNGTKPFVSSC